MTRFKVFLTTLAVLLFVSTASAQASQADVATKYNEAVDLLNAKKYVEAIAALDKVVELGAEIPEALDMVQKAQQLIPTCYLNYAMTLAVAGKLEDAVKELTTTLEKAELYGNIEVANKAKRPLSQIYQKLAADSFNNKQYGKAIEIYQKAYTANSKDVTSALHLAMSYCELSLTNKSDEDMDKGLAIYSQVIELGPTHNAFAVAAQEAKEKSVYYLMLKAGEAAQAKDNDQVFAITDKALEINPASPEVNMLRMQTANNIKNYEKVLGMGETVAQIQTTPELQSTAYFLLAMAYQNKDNKAKAIELYKKVVVGANVATAKAQITALSK